MKSLVVKLIVGMAALAITGQTQAALTVSLEPSSHSIDVGDSAFINVIISGLGEQTSPSLGGFALELSYNPTTIEATSLLFGNHLDLGVFGSIQFSEVSPLGLIRMDEVSFETAADLNAAQPESFTLATIGFTALRAELSTINFTAASFSDETGGLSLPFTTSGAQIQVNGPVQVPDTGSTAALLLLAMFCVCCPSFLLRQAAVGN